MVKNDVSASGGGPAGDVFTTAGSAVSVPYWVDATGGTCDPANGTPLTLTVNKPAGVEVTSADSTWSAAASSLVFTQCNTAENNAAPNNTKTAAFSSTVLGRHNIPVVSTSDAGGSYTVGTTAFKLNVNPRGVTEIGRAHV